MPNPKNKKRGKTARINKSYNINCEYVLTNLKLVEELSAACKYSDKCVDFLKATHPFNKDLKTCKAMNRYNNQNINIEQHITQNYKIDSIIGKGAYGDVFSICNDLFDFRAIKVQMFTYPDDALDFIHEYEMQLLFAGIGLGLNVYSISPYALRYGIMEMDIVHGTMEDFLVNKWADAQIMKDMLIWVCDIIDLLMFHKLSHGDLHWKNIGYKIYSKDSIDYIRIILLDFGFAQIITDETVGARVDISQLIRTLDAPDFRKMLDSNKSILIKGLYEKYKMCVGVPDIFQLREPSDAAISIYMDEVYKSTYN